MKRLAILLAVLASCGKDEPAKPAGPPAPALETRACPSGGEMALLPAGEFTMGHASAGADATPHAVRVDAVWVDRFAVTQEIYQKVMGSNPSKRKEPKNPVERMQWTAAARFCNKASEMDGLSPCYDPKTWDCDFEADGYRLPTEAEWEYACRAGGMGRFSFGDDPAQISAHGWCKPGSGGAPHPVGGKKPNAWGLHDMHGNVWQWCNDVYGETYYKGSPPANPRGPASGTQRVLRGGAADSPAEKCGASVRSKENPVFTDACFGADYYGFRRARNPAGKQKDKPVAATTQDPPKPPPVPVPVPAAPAGKIDPARLKGTILFVSDRGGALDVWRMRADGSGARPLTKDAHQDADPRFSPDGKRILYTSLRGGFPEVWLMNRDGSDAKKVTPGSQGAWSPDGKSIAFIRDNQAFARDLAAGTERRVTPEKWERCGVPAWLPDGTRLAVASRHEETIGIYLLGLDGREIERLKTGEAACTPCFSRDGKKVLYQTTRGRVHQMEVDGKGDEPVTFGADIQHEGRYSPDGTLLVFTRAPAQDGPWQICVADLLSDDLAFIALTKEGSNNLPDWHADED